MDESNELGERIKLVRAGRSQADFADHLGLSVSSLRRYESGERLPDAEFFLAITAREQVNTHWLLTGHGPQRVVDYAQALSTAANAVYGATELLRSPSGQRIRVPIGPAEYWIDPADYRWVPFFDVDIAAGGGRTIDPSQPPKKFNAYRRDYLEEGGLLDAELFEARIVGESMEPDIRGGEIVLVNASEKTIYSGEAYILQIGEEWLCKYLQRLPNERIEVSSANPVHKTFEIREGELGQGVEIVGLVHRQGRDRRRLTS